MLEVLYFEVIVEWTQMCIRDVICVQYAYREFHRTDFKRLSQKGVGISIEQSR
jgi:hypothetical protein